MSKLLRKIGKVINTRSKDPKSDSDESSYLRVDAIPTEKAVIPRPNSNEDHEEILEPQDIPSPSMNQANQFNSPNQTVYQFNHANGIHIGNNFTINQNITQDHNPEDRSELEDDDSGKQDEAASSESTKVRKAQPNSKELRKKYPKTRTIELLLKSETDLDHFAMDIIATHLGEDWRSVARDLGFSNGEIDHFYEDNFAYGVKEVNLNDHW